MTTPQDRAKPYQAGDILQHQVQAMKYCYLGTNKLKLSAIGYGCPPFVGQLNATDENASIDVILRAIELGITYIDTADHNAGNNEEILAKALKGRRDEVVLSSKFGNLRGQPWAAGRLVDGRPEYVAQACEASLRRLGTDFIDLYYLHRIDPEVPVEDTVGAMRQLVEQGKILHIGLSEAGPDSIRRANDTYPITAVQSEYSLWTRDYEVDTLPVVQELGIGFVPYYPLGRGFFTGSAKPSSKMDANDTRRNLPRFSDANLPHNLRLLNQLKEIANNKGCTTGQIALAWILHQGDDRVPIPGTKQLQHVTENATATELELTKEELDHIDALFPQSGRVAGARFDRDRSRELNI